MHIGILTACYRPVVNGVTQVVELYDKHLTAAGHQVTIFTLGQPLPGEDSDKVIRSPGLFLGQSGYHVAARYSPAAQRKLQSVDIVHCHHLLMGLEFARRYGSGPIVFTNHTRYDLYLSSYGHVPQWLAGQMMGCLWRQLTSMADVVIAPSASIRDLLRDAGVNVPIEVIENGVEVERFQQIAQPICRAALQIPDEAMVLTYVGRFAPEKQVLRLINEFRMAAIQRDDVFLLGVGGGPMLNRIKRMASESGLAGRTRFVGAMLPERVPAFLALSDAFVSASITEVHPLTVIEALASGLPVIAVTSPGMSDTIESDVSGLLVNGQEGSLANAMITLAGNDPFRHRLAAGAKAAGSQYDIRGNIERTLALYRRLIRQHYVSAIGIDAASHAHASDACRRRAGSGNGRGIARGSQGGSDHG